MAELTVAVAQSNYLPWRGYFDLIHKVDLFVFYDDVQFTKNDWRNRNIIKSAQGTKWLSIPVGGNIRRLICEVEINDSKWQENHWRTLQYFYQKAPHFELFKDFFEAFFMRERWVKLSDLNQYLIKTISTEFLGIETSFVDSRRFSIKGTRQDRLLDLLTQIGATKYVSGPRGKNYLENSAFENRGIALEFMDYSSFPEYPQFGNAFDGHVSIVDLLFQCGHDSSKYIWK